MDIKGMLELAGIILAGLSALAGIVGYLAITYKKASREKIDSVVGSADQLSNFWKEQVDGFKVIVSDLQAKINSLTGEIGELRGQLNEKTKQAEEYKQIFQGQNPEMKQFMETMLAVSHQSQVFMEEDKKFKKDAHDALMAIVAHLSPQAISSGLKLEGTITKQ